MSISIEAIGPDRLADYAKVPMVCRVQSTVAVEEINGGISDLRLLERPVELPYTKDYDAYPDGGPLNWQSRFDISRWGMWIAHENGEPVGGAAVARKTANDEISEGDRHLATLWDIRVRGTHQRRGVGTALFQTVSHWAKSQGCKNLEVESQNVNVAACRFYARMGCFLSRIDRTAYQHLPELASEVMLIWRKPLSGG